MRNMVDIILVVSVLHIAIFPLMWSEVSAIDCYECHSFNKSDPNCGDPFHPIFGVYKKDCTQGKEGHFGEFRAKFCIKLIGTTVKHDIQMVFRGCSLETLDSQCGDFKYEDVRYHGCVMSCTEDGCNSVSGLHMNKMALFVIVIFVLHIMFFIR